MRGKIARKWRKEILRRGVKLTNERMIISKSELKKDGLKRKDNGFGFYAIYNGFTYIMNGSDELDAYRSFVRFFDEEANILKGI